MTKKLTRENFMEILLNKPYWGHADISDELEKQGYIEPEKEPLTFSQIRKECVSGESVLVNEHGERVYVGFDGVNRLVTYVASSDTTFSNPEDSITNWTIKPKEEKKTIEIDREVWVNVYECGRSTMHVSREAADNFSNNDRIACEKFELKRSVAYE